MTWACPDWTLSQVLTAAIKYGYDAVEPRVDCKQMHGIELTATKKARKEIRANFEDMGIACCCLATSQTYSTTDAAVRAESVEQTKRYIDLAKEVGCPNLRVFGGKTPEGAEFAAVKGYVAEALRECAEHAKARKVSVCLETHDGYCHSADTVEVVRLADHPSLGICWDIMHPFRVGETIAQAFDTVKDYVRHCHCHDGKRPEGGGADGWVLALMGEGDIPHDEAFRLLAGTGYEGALSGEHIDYLPAEELLPHEARVMRGYL
jgi:sugar phosphate isomerase/epimerase